jgi:hypothetical protein
MNECEVYAGKFIVTALYCTDDIAMQYSEGTRTRRLEFSGFGIRSVFSMRGITLIPIGVYLS